MRKLQSTVHFLLSLKKKTKIFELALLGPVLFLLLSNQAHAEIKIAFIDTGLCPITNQPVNIKIEKVVDLTNSVVIDCNLSSNKFSNPRYHGQFVVEEFLKFLKPKLEIHIYPLIVFNYKGEQRAEYWTHAIEWLKKNKIDLVVSASGFITQDLKINELPGIWFVSSGRVTPQIKTDTTLFPQSLAPKNNLFLIGDYFSGTNVLYDQALLNQEKIDFYFPSGPTHFSGTSRAVAEASAKAISLCPLKLMKGCLKKLSHELVDNIAHKKIQTY